MVGVGFNIVRIETKPTRAGDTIGERRRDILLELQWGTRTIGEAFGVLLYKLYYSLILKRKLVGGWDTNHVINSL